MAAFCSKRLLCFELGDLRVHAVAAVVLLSALSHVTRVSSSSSSIDDIIITHHPSLITSPRVCCVAAVVCCDMHTACCCRKLPRIAAHAVS